jgi:hypothetical protein
LQQVWLVERGNLTLFIENTNLNYERDYLFTVSAGEAIFGIKKLNYDFLTLLAIATEPTELKTISLNNLATQKKTEDAIALLGNLPICT